MPADDEYDDYDDDGGDGDCHGGRDAGGLCQEEHYVKDDGKMGNCPFRLNLERFEEPSRADHWPGGLYFEVLVSATRSSSFWETDHKVMIQFDEEMELAENGCDESVTVVHSYARGFAVAHEDCV